jgi:YHS domain-containing protein
MRNLLICLFLIFAGTSAFAAGTYDSAIYVTDSNLALGGWDTVSFLEGNSPEEGSGLWKTDFKDALWHFSSEKNLNLFKSDPDKYVPAYGGYCAWAMSEGNLAPGRPEHWDVIDGRLYLNYSSSTRKKFLADIDNMIKNADAVWPEIESTFGTE